jgi:hypothetical protein
VRRRVLHDRDEAEQQARQDRGDEGEQQRGRVEADRIQPRQVRGGQEDEEAKQPIRDPQAEDATREPEGHALEEQLARDPAPVRPQGHAHGQLLLAALHAHEQQVRDVRAGDEQHEDDRAHEDPEDAADVAHEVLLERPQAGSEARLLEHLLVEAARGREPLERHRQQARHVRVGLREGGARLEPGHALVAELPEQHLGPVEPQREDEGVFEVEEAEVARHHADDLHRLSVDGERPPDRGRIATELGLPIAVAEDDGGRAARLVVLAGERAAEEGGHAKEGKDSVGHAQHRDPLRLRQPGHACRPFLPQPDVLERPALLAIREIEEGRGVEVRDVDAGCRVPEAHELVRVRVGQGLEEDAVEDAEDRGVGPDGDGQGRHRDRREQGRPDQPPHDVLQLIGNRHGSPGYAQVLVRVSK